MEQEQLSTLEQVSAKGRYIYEQRYRTEYEAAYAGKYVAVDVVSEEAFVADSPIEAMHAAKRMNPDHLVHLMRIGGGAVVEVGFLGRETCHSWL